MTSFKKLIKFVLQVLSKKTPCVAGAQMSMRPQAHDIIRTWAFDTIVKSWMHNGIAPWKDIVISGHVLADSKEKLSKSKSNARHGSGDLLLQQYPADAIRYWTTSGRLGQDMMFSEEQLKIGQKLITKMWNVFLFAQPHLVNFVKHRILHLIKLARLTNGSCTRSLHALKNISNTLNNMNLV